MKTVQSNKLKSIILLALTIAVFVLWQIGLEKGHAKIICGSANVVLKAVGSESYFEVEKTHNQMLFWIHTTIEGRRAKFPQKIGALFQPTVMILAWQIFLFFVLSTRKALRLLLINLGLFTLLQVIFLFQLKGYYTSSIQKFIYEFMVSSFYVIALIFVMKDNFFYRVFGKPLNPKTD